MNSAWKLLETLRPSGTRGYRGARQKIYNGPIVISGISGRFPKANNTKELNEKLLNGEELTSDTKSRWIDEMLPKRCGFLHCLDQFDAGFFNIPPRQANHADPQIRLLLEATLEAIIDAGVNPADLRGSETGVFCGAVGGETQDHRAFHFNRDDEGIFLMGASGYMTSARIAFSFDLRGPSSHVCTGCSSSFTALDMALNYIQLGKCEAAIVTGSTVHLNSFGFKDFMAINALAPDGRCKTFDESADGFTRSEAAVAILVQKEGAARRNYARIRGLTFNTDGFKHVGLLHPTRTTQEDLLRKAYERAGIDPSQVSYLEAHGTGTSIGDLEEVHAVHSVFCEGRKRLNPLLIGSVKTNVGHTECAAGLVGVAKVIGAIQSGTIPGNVNFKRHNPKIKSLFDGSLKVLTEATAFDGGIVALTSLGIGGTNCHLILEPGLKKTVQNPQSNLPALFPLSGRSEEQVEESIAEAIPHAENSEFVYLLQKAYQTNITGHTSRGFGLSHAKNGKNHVEVTTCESRRRPVWIIFPGMGSQWNGMGQDLLRIEPFAQSIQQSRMTLRNLGMDLDDLLNIHNKSIFSDIQDAFIAVTVMQIALWDTLKELQIIPDGFIGHSVGECLCAYADECLSAEETLRITHARGRAMKETRKVDGRMSSIGMSADKLKPRLPSGIQLACYNTPNNVTISGEYELVTSFTKKMREEGEFAAPVNTCGIAAHSSHVREAAALLKSYAQNIIKGDRARSPRWISSSIPEADWGSDLARFASADYFENNVFHPVLFSQALQHVQSGSVVIEVSPKGYFQALLAQTVPSDSIHVAPMTAKADDKLWHFFQSIGKLYTSGLDIQMDRLYPAVSTPVSSNVPSLSHLVKWDHSVSWKRSILELPLDRTYESVIDIEHPNYSYLAGHKIEDRVLMPATGLLCGLWNQLGDISGRPYESFPVQFKNVVLKRATILSPGVKSTILYKINTKSGTFIVENQDEILVTGQIERLAEKPKGFGQLTPLDYSSDLVLTKNDFYKLLRLNGCNHNGLFQGIVAIDSKGKWADITWKDNWTCFLDAMLQSTYLSSPSNHLGLPVDFEMITIDPQEFKQHLRRTFEETGKNVVRAVNLPNQKKIIAPGIEIKGLEVRILPRIPRRDNLSYERHSFCPFVDTSEGLNAPFEEIVDLVLENTRNKHLLVADVFTRIENSRARDFEEILSLKPRQSSTITMVTLISEAEKLEDGARVGSVIAKETKESLTPQTPTDLVFLDDPSLLPLIEPSIKPNGFALVQSKGWTLDGQLIGLQKCWTRQAGGDTLDLYRKVEPEIPEIVHVPVDSLDFAWVSELQQVILKTKGRKCKIYVTSQRDFVNGILGLVNCLRWEDGGERIRCIFDPQGQLSLNFNEPDPILRSIVSSDLFANVYKNGSLGSYRHLRIPEKGHPETRSTPHDAFVGTLTPGDLSSFRWIESPLLEEGFHAGSDRNPCHEPFLKRYKVAYTALNFRDVLLATTTIPLHPKFSYDGSYLGFEFSGFDEGGKRVMGICPGKGLATSVITDSRYVWEVPENWTLEEAATVPVVYATVLYAFHERAGLEPGKSVLIHAGSGGIGHAAISIALAHGCKVFTTVGTPEKRDYIKKAFPQLANDYIGNSRDTSFEGQVMEMTQGRGVDVALNSLAGDKLLATVRCVAPNGTFLEIGVADAFMNTRMGLRPLLKNINVSGVDLHHVFERNAGCEPKLRQLVQDGINSGAVKPLPRRVFECNQVEQAFRFMANGKHVGKLAIKICDERNWKEPLNLPPVIKRSYFSPNKTYLIIGGLGGLGMELAGWMVDRGARKLVLNSRSGVTNGYQKLCLRKWREAGVQVEILTQDLSDKSVAELYVEKMVGKGEKLGGIFNSALVLVDDEFPKQTVRNFQQVSKPKDCLTKVLDEISRKLCPDLDYFVGFSSLTCGFGNEDQTNYGWANSAMERICEKRREDGLHGLAIQWGILGQVGYVVEKVIKGPKDKFELHGTLPQGVQSCLEVLDSALQQSYPVLSSLVIAEKGAKKGAKEGLLSRMEKIFGIADFKALPKEKRLSEFGLDSLVAVELKSVLEREHEILLKKDHLQLLTVGDILSIDAGTFDANKFKSCGTSQGMNVLFKLHTTLLVKLKSHPYNRHAFIVHGSDGGCDHFEPLAARLMANVYGLQFTGIGGWSTLPELARLYANEIQEKQPTGPYTIMGYSGGSVIAFEIAQRLQQLNEIVQNLVLLDGPPCYENFNVHHTFALDMLKYLDVSQNLTEDSMKAFESSLNGNTDEDFLQVFNVLKLATGHEHSLEQAEAYKLLFKQIREYIPSEPFDGDITLIQAPDQSVLISKSGKDSESSEYCTGKVIVHEVKGNHMSFLIDDNVDETASVINGLLI